MNNTELFKEAMHELAGRADSEQYYTCAERRQQRGKTLRLWVVCASAAAVAIIAIAAVTVGVARNRTREGSGAGMVYASGEQLDRIYAMLQDESYDLYKAIEVSQLTVVKDSITPVYEVDLLETARTGEAVIIPMRRSHTGASGQGEGEGNVFTAKTVTFDGQFGGNIMFYVEGGTAYNMLYSPSEYSPLWPGGGNSYPASSSYADHAARIAELLNEDNMISPYDVKYVAVDMAGEFFYISNSEHNVLVATGFVAAADGAGTGVCVDYCIDAGSELVALATDYSQKYNEFLAEKAAWEAEHPGELWDKVGAYGLEPIVSGCSRVDNIVDIADFLQHGLKTAAAQDGKRN